MKVLIVGSEGNMGGRYKAVLNYLKIPYCGIDKKLKENSYDADISHVIVATPTETHEEVLGSCYYLKVPFLCEKPITKDLKALGDLLKHWDGRLSMVNQYFHLPYNDSLRGPTYYNYFKHGTDGLGWDCIQLLGLAKGSVELREDSPIWQCVINGQQMSLADMDQAYISMMEYWLMGGRPQTPEAIYQMHEKAHKYGV